MSVAHSEIHTCDLPNPRSWFSPGLLWRALHAGGVLAGHAAIPERVQQPDDHGAPPRHPERHHGACQVLQGAKGGSQEAARLALSVVDLFKPSFRLVFGPPSLGAPSAPPRRGGACSGRTRARTSTSDPSASTTTTGAQLMLSRTETQS